MNLICRKRYALASVFLLAAGSAYAGDPAVGVWKLDVLHSKFSSDPAPLSELRIYAETPEGTKVTVKTVNREGKETVTEYPVVFDGKDQVRPGYASGTSIVLKRDNDYHASAVVKHAGTVMADVQRSITDDGATMTITYKGKNETGDPIDRVLIYHRVVDGQSR